MGSVRKRGGKWQARYRDAGGGEHAQTFPRKLDAERWLTDETSKLHRGTWIDPEAAKTTVADWCDTWQAGHHGRPSTQRSTESALKRIKAEFGHRPLRAVLPSQVKAWTVRLQAEGLADSYVRVLYKRLAQLMTDAVEDGLIARSPCSRRIAPKGGEPRAYVPSTRQVWALHDALPGHLRVSVLLGAFAGLRIGEICGLRPGDVDFAEGMIRPAVQYPAQPLKTDVSRTPIPVPWTLLGEIEGHMARWPGATVLTGTGGCQVIPDTLRRAVSAARVSADLPSVFRVHDLRHFYASLLIASGMDVKTVQTRMRHANAAITLNTYAHLWPGRDDLTRAAVEAVFQDHVVEPWTGEDGR